jgi:site-specific recombinase XerD
MIRDPKMNAVYWQRLARVNAAGVAPLALRVTIDGVRTELSPDVACPPAYWSKSMRRLVLPADEAQWVLPDFSTEEVERLNNELYQFKCDVGEVYKRLQRPEPHGPLQEFTAADLLAEVRGHDTSPTAKAERKAQAQKRPLLEVCRLFVDALQDKPKADRLADSTLQNYESRLNVLTRYLKAEYNKGFSAAEVDVPWCRRYERWLISEQGGFGGMAMRKQVNFLQLALDYAVAEGWLPIKKLHGYKYQTRASIPLALSLPADEVARLAAALPGLCDTEQRAVTGWLFCLHTGLSWVDYVHFCASPGRYLFTEPPTGPGQSPTHWLRMVRQKMKRRKPQGFSVPLFDEAADLLVKWQGNLPVVTNQNVNFLLHLVEERVGLSQPLTTKLARATFSQFKRDAGYSDEAVAAMMGDSVVVMNRHYSKVSERRLLLEMAQLGSIPTAPEPLKVANKMAIPPSTTIPAPELPAPRLTSPIGPHYPIVVGPSCAAIVQRFPLVPQLAATRRRPPVASPWRRPAPVTSHDEPEQTTRVIPMWGSTGEGRKEVAACG